VDRPVLKPDPSTAHLAPMARCCPANCPAPP
jgi:hypothetical protein